MKTLFSLLTLAVLFMPAARAQSGAQTSPRVRISNGILEGNTEPSGIRSFKGIPFAQPPVGELRWKEPQPVKSWTGVRPAKNFGPRAMQRPIYSDMVFRSDGISEDCLYLNVWTPAKSANEHLPVLIYFYGGGLSAGDGSEPRYDGESMARKGIVTLTVNYRLGIFGFFSHPELTKESPHHASGNYGFLDQNAAIRWVQKNIAAFGGDPKKVTIAGESAGSMSVSAQMASPLSKGLFAGVIGESGSLLGNLSPAPLAEGEQNGLKFAALAGAGSLNELRKIPADQLLELTAKPGASRSNTVIDGYFLPKSPTEIFATGLQSDVVLLAGWNSAEVNYHSLLGKLEPTVENYKETLKKLYKDRAEEAFAAYPAVKPEDVIPAATDLASDRFIAYSTWKWIDLHGKTDKKPVYRYLFSRQRPKMTDPSGENTEVFIGASHASEIEYALGNLSSDKVYAWTPDDYKVSETMQGFFANFIKTGNPNGSGLPEWSGLQSSVPKVMIIDVNSRQEPEKNQKRYQFIDQFYNK